MDEVSEKHQISIMNWPGYSDEPEVSFKIAYTSQELIIKYEVTEYYVMAQYTESNQSVFQDSCVEFFVTPITEGPYYNFEFNAIGTCLMQTGLARHDREPGDNDVIKRIRRLPSLGFKPFSEQKGKQSWSLLIALPLEILFGHPEPDLSGKIIRANLYKCGDKLRYPHYLSWNPIKTDRPDFHRPEFFGVMEFN